MHVDAFARPSAADLADRLEERQRLDVADGAADLQDDDVASSLHRRAGCALDLVRDVRDDLDGRAQVLPAPLLADDRVPDRPGRVVCVRERFSVDEPLVVAEVEIGLGAVLGDEDLAVLVRAHRPRIDVDVRVELLNLHLHAARLQQRSERGGGDPLPEDDATPPVTNTYFVRRPRSSATVRSSPRGRSRTGSAPARSSRRETRARRER